MKNKKIIYLVIISVFLLSIITALSVAGINTIESKDNTISEPVKKRYNLAYIDGSIIGSIKVEGIKGAIGFFNKDITVSGTVVEEEFSINTLHGTIPFSVNEKIDLHIRTLSFSAIGMECFPPYIESISGLAFGVTIN